MRRSLLEGCWSIWSPGNCPQMCCSCCCWRWRRRRSWGFPRRTQGTDPAPLCCSLLLTSPRRPAHCTKLLSRSPSRTPLRGFQSWSRTAPWLWAPWFHHSWREGAGQRANLLWPGQGRKSCGQQWGWPTRLTHSETTLETPPTNFPRSGRKPCCIPPRAAVILSDGRWEETAVRMLLWWTTEAQMIFRLNSAADRGSCCSLTVNRPGAGAASALTRCTATACQPGRLVEGGATRCRNLVRRK